MQPHRSHAPWGDWGSVILALSDTGSMRLILHFAG